MAWSLTWALARCGPVPRCALGPIVWPRCGAVPPTPFGAASADEAPRWHGLRARVDPSLRATRPQRLSGATRLAVVDDPYPRAVRAVKVTRRRLGRGPNVAWSSAVLNLVLPVRPHLWARGSDGWARIRAGICCSGAAPRWRGIGRRAGRGGQGQMGEGPARSPPHVSFGERRCQPHGEHEQQGDGQGPEG